MESRAGPLVRGLRAVQGEVQDTTGHTSDCLFATHIVFPLPLPLPLPPSQVGDLAHALAEQWKRLCMAYSPPREEPEGGFLSDLSYSEEEMEEVVAVPPGGDLPTDSSDEFDFNI